MDKQRLGLGVLIIFFSAVGVYLSFKSIHTVWLTTSPNQDVESTVKWAYGYFTGAILAFSLAVYFIVQLIRKIRDKRPGSYLKKEKKV